MSPPSSMTAGRMRVSSSSLIMATTSLSSSWIAVSLFAALWGSVNNGSPVQATHASASVCHLHYGGHHLAVVIADCMSLFAALYP